MFSIYKNSILQQDCSINVRLINRCVDKAALKPTVDAFDHEPAFFRLLSEQPHVPVEHVDIVRRPLAYGRWALPKLYRELHSKDPIVVLQAVNSICDLVQDPEKTFEAIRLKFVKRLGNLLRHYKNVGVEERILTALRTIGSQALGREAIFGTPKLLNTLKDFVADSEEKLRYRNSQLIEMLSRCFIGCCTLIENGFISLLVNYVLLDNRVIIENYLRVLEKLFTQPYGQEEALNINTIEKLVTLLEHNNSEIVSLTSNCLALLVSHPDGKQIAVDISLLTKLNDLLHNENRNVYTSAAAVIMFATLTVTAKLQAVAIPGLANRLLALTNDFNHAPAQMFAMKALGNMCEFPKLRKDMLDNHMDEIEAIQTCEMPELKTYKANLIKLIKWKPWVG